MCTLWQFIVLYLLYCQCNLEYAVWWHKFKIKHGFDVDSSAASQMKHNKTVHDTKSAEVSSPDRRKPDIAQAAVQGVHAEDDKPAVAVSTTSKASVTPTYKALSGQVSCLYKLKEKL